MASGSKAEFSQSLAVLFFSWLRFAALRLIIDENMRVGRGQKGDKAGNEISVYPLVPEVYQDQVGPRRCVCPFSL